MTVESYIGILYCLIGLVHLAVLTIKTIKTRTFYDAEEIFIVTFAWPLADVLWVIKRAKT